MKIHLPKSFSFSFASAINKCVSFSKVLTLVLILATSLSFAQNNNKIAPAFLSLIDNPITKENEKTYPELFKITEVNGLNPKTGKYENGYICIIYTKFPEVLKENGIAIQSTYPTYVTAWVTLAQIPIIANLKVVTFIDAPKIIMPNNDVSVGSSGASLLHAGKVNNIVYKGDGVIVAIVDSGIDWDHPDFRNFTDQTKSRILRIWDQTLTPISGEVSPTGFNYGVEYTQSQINNEIDGSPVGFVREVDTNGHGTHVAGTAAGNGAALSTFKYTGLAPNADIVVVKGGNGSFTSTNIINSLTYLQNLATTLGKPIVVNMSLGGQSSAHDGTDPQEIAVDAFSNSAPGRVVVIAAGNDNGIAIHKQNSIASSGNTAVSIVVPSASASTSTDVFQYTCYANDASAINATITAPGGTSATVNANSSGGFSIMGGLATVYFSNSIDVGSGDRKINVYLVRASTTASVSGTWTLTLANATTNALTIDGWLNYKGSDFATTTVTSGDSNYLVASPGCANNAITVGSYMAKIDWSSANGSPNSYPLPSQQDNISSFSSIGPRRDNIQKPDITANGQAVVSCLSSDSGLTNTDPYMVVNGLYRVEQGTSMATPEVAGCVALLLQINKNATYSQIKTTLTTTATKDAFTTASDNNIWGSGKIDVFKAASSQLYCNTLNRLTYSYDASYTATNNSQVNLGALKATTRFTPAISGQLGGVYFKTGSVVTLTSFTIEVRTNSLGIPGTLLNSLTVTPSSVSKYSWNYYDLSSLNITVTSGTDYFIILVPGAGSTFYIGQDPASVGRSFYYNGAAWIAQSDFRIRSVVYTTGNLVPSVALSSAVGTNAQTKCINTAVTNITYATTGATGATFSGLPSGVTGAWASNVVTISGTPTVAGTYNYTVTLTVSCSAATATGSIIVNANTATLSSAVGTNAQTKCISTVITDITYTTTGATGATFSGLPNGLTGNWTDNLVTISGTPSVAGTYNYIVTLTGGCSTLVTGTIIVNAIATATSGGPNSVCQSASPVAFALASASVGGSATKGAWSIVSGGGTLNSTAETATPATVTYTPAANYTGTVTLRLTSNSGTGCSAATADRTLNVNAIPTVTAGGPTSVCQSGSPAAFALAGASVGGSATTGAWSIVLGGGTLSSTAATATPDTVTYTPVANYTGIVTLRLTSNSGTGCNAATADRTVNVNAIATATSGGPNSVCQSASPAAFALAGARVGGSATTGAWSIISGGGTLSSTAQTATPATVTYTPVANYTGTVTLRLTSNYGTACSAATTDRTVNVNAISTLTISSALGTDSQTLCTNKAITNITYVTTGATGATFSGLPAGVTGAWLANVVTISGTPSAAGTNNYTVTLTGGCGAVTATGSIVVSAATVLADNAQPNHLGNGLNFDGVDDNVTINDATVGNFGTGAFTIELWVKTTLSNCNLINKRQICNNTSMWNLKLQGGRPYVELIENTSALNQFFLSASATVNDGTWHHVAFTRSATGGVGTIYIDGVLSATATGAIANISTTTPVKMGDSVCTVAQGVSFFKGTMDEMRLWMVERTASQILASMNVALVGNETSLVADYECNQGTAEGSNTAITTLTDKTANAKIGTLNLFNRTGRTSNFVNGGGLLSTCVNTNTAAFTNSQTSGTWSVTPLTGSASISTGGVVTGLTAGKVIVKYSYGTCNDFTSNMLIINAANSSSLTSVAGSDSQTKCINTAITPITYSTTGATGATFSGLPTGVTGAWAANVVGISGTPSVAGTYNYSVTLTGGCAITITGSIIITPIITITLSSAAGTNAQTKCINTAIADITYTTIGSTGASFSGLPTGVSGARASNVVTISGIPSVSGTYTYIVALTGGCSTVTATGSIAVTAAPVAIAGGPNTVCLSASPVAFALAGASVEGSATTGAWSIVSGGGTLSSTAQTITPTSITYTPPANFTGTVTLRLTSNAGIGCTAVSADRIVTVTSSLTSSVSITSNADNNTICAGTTVIFTATPTNGGAIPSFQWKLNGANVGTNSAIYTIPSLANGDIVTVVMTPDSAFCSTNSSATAIPITTSVTPTTSPIVTLESSSTSGTPYCAGSDITFHAITNNAENPTFQWKVNGNFVQGDNDYLYTYLSLANGDNVSVEMTVTNTCVLSSVVSDNMTVEIKELVYADVMLMGSVATGDFICSATYASFTAYPLNGGDNPTFKWKLNGEIVGDNSAYYSNTSWTNGDVVTVEMTSNADCVRNSPATSSPITISVNPTLFAEVSISSNAVNNTICAGTSVIFTANPTNGGLSPSYQWKLNGFDDGTNSNTYTNPSLSNEDIVTVEMTSNATPCLVGSPALAIGITTTVTNCNQTRSAILSLQAGDETICNGDLAHLIITATGTGPFSGMINGTIPFEGNTSPIEWLVEPWETTTFSITEISDASGPIDASQISGQVQVIVNDCNQTRSAVLSVQAGDETICNGDLAHLIITATGTGPFSGMINGTIPFEGNTSPIEWLVEPWETTTFSITEISDASGPIDASQISGQVQVIVNDCNETISAVLFLQAGDETICNGDLAHLIITATGTGPFSGMINGTIPFEGNTSPIEWLVEPWETTTFSITEISDASGPIDASQISGQVQVIVNDCNETISAVLSLQAGDETICNGDIAHLSIAVTGTGPWSGTLSDGTSFSGSNNPILVSVEPTETTTYTIATLSSETATASAADLSGSATVMVNEPTTATTVATSCGMYIWETGNNSDYFETGTYSYTENCVTYILELTVTQPTTETTVATSCGLYIWETGNNSDYFETGTYSYTENCVTHILELTVIPSSDNITTVTACDSYTWNGTVYTTSGIKTGTTTNCVTEKLDLTIDKLSITAQPTNPAICKLVNATATVTVMASTTATATYQWFAQAATASTWTPIVNNANYAGATTATLTITRTTTTLPATGTKYKAVVSGGQCAAATSGTVTLQESLPSVAGTITTNAASVCLGGSITYTLSGYVGSVQWQLLASASATTGTVVGTGASYTASNVSGTPLYLRAVVTSGTCVSTKTAVKTIVVNPTTVAGTITGAATVCPGGGATLKLVSNVGTAIQWKYSANGVSYTNVPTTTVGTATSFATTSTSGITATYIVTNVTQSTWFKATVKSGLCNTEETAPVQVIVGTTVAGNLSLTAGSSNTICSGTATSLTLSGHTGTIAWQKSANYYTTTTPTWTAVAGTTATVSTGALTNTTATATVVVFRANVTLGTCGTIPTAVFPVNILPAAKGGTVAVNNTTGLTVCAGGSKELKVTGSVGSIQWQKSTTSATAGFVDVPAAITTPYTFDAITQNTWFRVVAKNGDCVATALSNAIAITVSTPVAVGTITAAANDLCPTNTGTSLTLAGHLGTISWAKSTNGGSTWTTVTGTAATLATGVLPVTTIFRAKLTSGSCFDYSTIVVTVKPATTATVSATASTICSGTATSVTVANYGLGTIQWQKATTLTGAYANVTTGTGINSATYVTPALTATTYFRALITDNGCSSGTTGSGVTISPLAVAKTITGTVTATTANAAICTSASQTLTMASGSVGTIQWQWSPSSSASGVWNDIPNQNATTINAQSYVAVIGTATTATYFRVKMTNSCSPVGVYSAAIAVFYKNCTEIFKSVVVKEEFNVIAYPNPYTENFNLSLTTTSIDKVDVMVYDMIGKLIEKRAVSPSEVSGLQVGDRYPSGVYNVVVTQGEEVRTLRVIKR